MEDPIDTTGWEVILASEKVPEPEDSKQRAILNKFVSVKKGQSRNTDPHQMSTAKSHNISRNKIQLKSQSRIMTLRKDNESDINSVATNLFSTNQLNQKQKEFETINEYSDPAHRS